MSISRTTRAAPTGASSNTLTSASFLAPTGELVLVAGFQGCSLNGAAALGISTSIAGIAFTKVVGIEALVGAKTVCAALWRTVGNGNSGTVTVSNAALGSQTTDLRVYSFPGAKELDPLVGGTAGGNGPGGVASSLGADSTPNHNFDLDSGATPPWGNSLNMGFLVGLESTEVVWDIRNLWSEVEQWDSGTTVPTSLQVIEQLGNTAGQVDGDYVYKFMLSSGATLGAAFIGASIRDATQHVSKVFQSRGARITATRF